MCDQSEFFNFAWRRYFARTIDSCLGWFILKGLLYGTSYLGGVTQREIGFWQWMTQPLSSLFDISVWLVFLIGMLLYVFSDAVVFAIFRQTFGKKICGISVCDVAGRKISPLDFLRRDFDVFLQTIWFYIPHFFQYKRVVNGRASSYDEGCIYQARPIRPMDCDKSTTIVFVLFVLSWAIFGFRREDTSENSITIQQPLALLPQAVEHQSPMPPPKVFDSPPSPSDIVLPLSPPAVEPQPPTPPPAVFKPDLKPVFKPPQLPSAIEPKASEVKKPVDIKSKDALVKVEEKKKPEMKRGDLKKDKQHKKETPLKHKKETPLKIEKPLLQKLPDVERPPDLKIPDVIKKFGAGTAPAPSRARIAVDKPPAPRRRIKLNYPKGARERGEEGEVTLELDILDISEYGVVDNVRIIKSCGFAELEQAAIQAVKDARFMPARRGSANVPSTARLTLNFRLKEELPSP